MQRSQHAFTLIEALISILIIAILIAIAIPFANGLITHGQDRVLQTQLIQSMEIAKQEARARHTQIGICGSSDQFSCDGSWITGYLIFIDENFDGAIHDKQQILALMQNPSPHGKIFWRAYPEYRNYLMFSENMESDNGSFLHCHGNRPVWAIIVNKTGRVRIPDSISRYKCE